ncbi:unnamed protein product [Aphanomyces euteiches]|uniref:TM7S3/TM198-like domain-containing protein n=1 Tax=Aphanomyces euteiches TaxID=100861 RepID=A0A6G0X4Q3_9STRA|nr:hypothetical protein Ae201684_008435 [Aphanomyces euteiches]KAH9149875.1 hypothetical protein AeRB84_007191 [Aphanomyces euteiches]
MTFEAAVAQGLLGDPTVLRNVVIAGSVFLLLANLFVTFTGCKYFNISLVLQGATLGGYAGWYIGDAIGDSIDKRSPLLNIFVAIGFALFFAFFTCVLRLFMKFLFGAALGVQIGSVLNVIWFHTIDITMNRSNPNTLGYIAMALFGLLLGLAALLSGRKSHIPITAWVGSYWVVQSIGNFIGNFPPMFYPFPEDAPRSVSATVRGWIALSLLGTVVQAHLTTFGPHPGLDDMDDIQLEKEYNKQAAYRSL